MLLTLLTLQKVSVYGMEWTGYYMKVKAGNIVKIITIIIITREVPLWIRQILSHLLHHSSGPASNPPFHIFTMSAITTILMMSFKNIMNMTLNLNLMMILHFRFPKWAWETCPAVNRSQLNITYALPPPHGRWEAPPVSFFLQFGHWQDIGTAAAWSPPPRWPDFIVTTLWF